MLNSHKNLLEPRPSDRLRIGDCIVDLSLREVSHPESGEHTRVTLKSAGVLLVLVANAGRVVSREALLEWVWPDTMPTDDVVTQAITQLRKALGNGKGVPYIETIAKQGYRLLAPVEWIVDEQAPTALAPPVADAKPVEEAPTRVDSNAQAARRMPMALALTVAAIALAALLYWGWSQRAVTPPVPAAAASAATAVPFRRMTSSPGSELWPSLSPDGALMVYSQSGVDEKGISLKLQTTSTASPRPLTEEAEGQYDMFPAWSPDGREIAFARAGEDSCTVMLVPATGGGARELGACLGGRAHPIAWYPDGSALIGAPAPMAAYRGATVNALHRMRLDAGRWEAIAYARSATDVDIFPKVSPDGRWIIFQRNVSLGDLWKMPVAGGVAQRVTRLRANIFGFDWTRDGSALVLSHYAETGPRLGKLDLASGALVDYPDRAYNMSHPVVSGNGDVAFVIDDSRSSIARVDLGAPEKDPEPLFEATTSNLIPGIAPDGRQLVFMSDRTGEARLWWVDQQAPDSLRAIDGFVPVPRHPVQWDADSSRFLAVGTGRQGMGVYEIEPRRGQATRLPLPDTDPVHAAYHADPGKLLVVADRGQGRLGLALYDRSRQPWRALARIDNVATAFMDRARNRIVFTRMSRPEIWQAATDLSNPQRLDSVAFNWRLRMLAVAAEGLWVMDAREGCDWWWRPVGTGASPSATVGECLKFPPLRMLEGLTYAAADRAMYVSISEETGSDIGMLPLKAFDGQPRVATR